MVDRTHAPNCKLELWATLHRRVALHEAQRAAAATTDPHRLAVIDDTLKSTFNELENEVWYLHGRQDVTEADVIALMERKELESRIERRGVNLTNHPSVRPDGSKIVWTKQELEQIARGLELLPTHTIADNPMLSTLERWDVSEKFPDAIAGYDPVSRVVQFFDPHRPHAESPAERGASLARTAHIGTERAEDLTHEIGHTLHYTPDENELYRETELFHEFARISGWQKDVKDEQLLNKAQFHPTLIAALRDGEKQWPVGKDGVIYQPDKYAPPDNKDGPPDKYIPGKVLARRNSTVPDSEDWAAAAIGPEEHWAEHVSKAVMTPAQLARDMFDVPATRLAAAIQHRDKAQRELDNARRAKSSPKIVRKRQHQLEAAEAAVVSAQYVQGLRKKQFDIIRTRFRADAATETAIEYFRSVDITAETIANFRREAERLTTPGQIAALVRNVLNAIAK